MNKKGTGKFYSLSPPKYLYIVKTFHLNYYLKLNYNVTILPLNQECNESGSIVQLWSRGLFKHNGKDNHNNPSVVVATLIDALS